MPSAPGVSRCLSLAVTVMVTGTTRGRGVSVGSYPQGLPGEAVHGDCVGRWLEEGQLVARVPESADFKGDQQDAIAEGQHEAGGTRQGGPCRCSLHPSRLTPGAAGPNGWGSHAAELRHCPTPGNSLRPPTSRIPCNVGLAPRLLRCRQMTSREVGDPPPCRENRPQGLPTSSHWCRGAGIGSHGPELVTLDSTRGAQ